MHVDSGRSYRNVDYVILHRDRIEPQRGPVCTHGCEYIIQLVERDTGDVMCAMCDVDAESVARVLLEGVERCAQFHAQRATG